MKTYSYENNVITMSLTYVCWHMFFIWSMVNICNFTYEKHMFLNTFFKTYETHMFYMWKTYGVPNIQQACGAFLPVYINLMKYKNEYKPFISHQILDDILSINAGG
jgi:hypothetical protein